MAYNKFTFDQLEAQFEIRYATKSLSLHTGRKIEPTTQLKSTLKIVFRIHCSLENQDVSGL